MARAMLIESKQPKFLWTYAVMAAAHIRNRMYCQRTKDTPYHMLTGKQPDMRKLHVFGSICYANNHQKTKLDPRSKKGIFVGYDKYSPSYLVYYPESNTVLKNGTVSFTERFDFNPSSPKSSSTKKNESEPYDDLDADNILRECDNLFSTPFDTYFNFNSRTVDELDDPIREEGIHDFAEDKQRVVDYEESGSSSRYPKRSRNPPERFQEQDFSKFVRDYCYKVSNLPSTYKQATRSTNVDDWQTAMETEMKALKENDVFSVVPLPKDKKLVGSRWVYSVKDKPDGSVLHKARFVAQGFSQEKGSDYSDTYSPTVKMGTVRMLIQFAAENQMPVHQLDVKTAYLNAPIDCEVYIRPPEGFSEENIGGKLMVWKLNKSLYGLKQSGRNWNIVLTNFFKSNGLQQSKIDPCLFVDEENATLIAIWVDDIIITASSDSLICSIKDLLKNRFKMTDLGLIKWFLGIEFEQSDKGISMCQSRYLKGVLERFDMQDCKPRTTPSELKLEDYDRPADNSTADITKYREMVGSLIYAMTCSRPDLAYIVTKLSQSLANPSQGDWITVKHVLRYIKGSYDKKLTYTKSQHGLKIVGFSDSDWASSVDRRSTTGYYFSLTEHGPPISWKSKKQHTIALSSCEAEYMALTAATQEAIFLKMLSKDFGLVTKEPIRINGDNQGSLLLAKNPVINERSKHIDIKHHFIREKYDDGTIDLTYVPTNDNIADLMTKPMSKGKLNYFNSSLFGQMNQVVS